MQRSLSPTRGERGMVTVELAIGVLAVVFLTFVCTWSVMLAVTQTRCGDVAAEVARQAARGDQAGVDRARQTAPPGSRVAVERRPGAVVVTVTADSSLGRVGPVHLVGRSVATLEPGVA